jgi:hypothetical protein
MKLLPPTNRNWFRVQSDNGTIVAFSDHALKRCNQRGLDPEQLLESLRGVRIDEYRSRGVIARWKPANRFLKVITVWKPNSKEF